MATILNRSVDTRDFPLGNYIVIVLASIIFTIQFRYDYNQIYLKDLILTDWSFSSILGHMWLHAGLLHIICNLVFLWIFGREVCLKIGSAYYFLAYIAVGFASAFTHLLYDHRPSIGASGAVFGILGMYMVLCFNNFSSAGPWIILTWFLLNLTVGITGILPIAYTAHIGGFFAGILIATALIYFEQAESKDTDASLLDLLQ